MSALLAMDEHLNNEGNNMDTASAHQSLRQAFNAMVSVQEKTDEVGRQLKDLEAGSPEWIEADREFNQLQREFDRLYANFKDAYRQFELTIYPN